MDEINTYLLDYHNHLQNILIGNTNKVLFKYLSELIREDVDNINSRLRVNTYFEMILQTADKEFFLFCK